MNDPKFKSLFLIITVFVTGAAVMVIEIVGAKVLHPFFGVTLYVWASMIAITLLALACGYWAGGKLADRFQNERPLFSAIFFSGIFTLTITLLATPMMRAFANLEIRTGVLLASTALFFLPLFSLGLVIPSVMKLSLKDLDLTGRVSGKIYAVSTIGSLVGTLGAGFWLIPSFPLNTILFGTGALLMAWGIIGFLVCRFNKSGIVGMLFLFLFVGALGLLAPRLEANTSGGKILYQTNSFYGQIKVVETKHLRALLVNGSPQNHLEAGKDFPNFTHKIRYQSYFASLLMLRPGIDKVMMIGMGAGSLASFFSRHGVRTDIIEIDPKMEFVAKEYFNFKPEQSRIIFGDGRRKIRQLHQDGESYDAIILDAFATYELPEHFYTLEMFQEAKAVLESDGVVAINMGGIVRGEASRVPASVLKTLQAVFKYVKAYHVDAWDKVNNIVLLASSEPLEWDDIRCRWTGCGEQSRLQTIFNQHEVTPQLDRGSVLTDDYNPLPFWAVPIYEDFRNRVLSYFGKEILSEV